MELTVKLFANFRDGRFREASREVPEGTSIADIVVGLGIDPKAVGVVLVNGRHAALEASPAPSDTVAIFPLIGGG